MRKLLALVLAVMMMMFSCALVLLWPTKLRAKTP